ncbi:MAG: sugar ABC transporter permease [Proteobacteria bacterium]|nr:sugar ABC transporter permease [Pseudomonadota bacterium]
MFDFVTATPTQAPPRHRGHRLRRRLVPYLFLLPFMVLFVLVLIVPLLLALDLSLYRDTLARGQIFVGLANYFSILDDSSLWDGLAHVVAFGVVQVPIMLAFALGLAVLLDSGVLWGRRLFRIAFFLPYAVPSVIGALIWAYMYGPSFGLFSSIAHAAGVRAPDFLSGRMMLVSLGNVVTWEYTGYNMIILYAALQAVPRDVVEASWICGATPWQTALRIRIPLIGQALVLTAVFSIIGTLQLFNEPEMFKAIAPDVIGDHYTPNLYAYTLAFTDQQVNASAALSFVLGAIVAVVSYIFMLATSRRAAGAG